jgi:6-pyruvoyltetrahydropterin/6-carboxytetrahydropterin synthase
MESVFTSWEYPPKKNNSKPSEITCFITFQIIFKTKGNTIFVPLLDLYITLMTKIRITKQFSFETGHALYGYDGKCKNVHGHSYKLFVTVIGSPNEDQNNVKYGMVIDFTDLKKIVKEEVVDVFDHATVFNKNTPHIELAQELKERGHHVILVDYQPTSEKMVIDFVHKIKSRLPENIELFSLRLQETDSSYAEWYASDN